jgi:hypothetical protein
MAYKYTKGDQAIGDLKALDDAQGDTLIDFEEDAIYLKTGASERFKISGSAGAITFNGAYAFPVTDGENNQVLQTNGSGQLNWNAVSGGGGTSLTVVSTKTSNYTASNSEVIPVNLVGSSGDITITLPAASSNAQVIIKVDGAANGKVITVDANAAEQIDGDANRTMDSDYESIHLISNGTGWFRIS